MEKDKAGDEAAEDQEKEKEREKEKEMPERELSSQERLAEARRFQNTIIEKQNKKKEEHYKKRGGLLRAEMNRPQEREPDFLLDLHAKEEILEEEESTVFAVPTVVPPLPVPKLLKAKPMCQPLLPRLLPECS